MVNSWNKKPGPEKQKRRPSPQPLKAGGWTPLSVENLKLKPGAPTRCRHWHLVGLAGYKQVVCQPAGMGFEAAFRVALGLRGHRHAAL
jgi:hypothetical protein